MAKQTYTRKQVLWLLKRQIRKCATAIGRMRYDADDIAMLKKLNIMKPVSLSEIKKMNNHKK